MPYYAAHSPRGFANEITVHVFDTRAARDEWVSEHEQDGDVNSASQGARAITAAEARRLCPKREHMMRADDRASEWWTD